MRVDVEEEQLVRLESRRHPFDRPRPAQTTELPHEISLRGNIEHHFGTPQRATHATSECFVAEDLLSVRFDNRVVIDVDGALANRIAQIRDAAGALQLLDAA